MEPDVDLSPDKDDLPLRANTSHILVRHYVLDMTIHLHRKVISGSIVLFLEPVPGPGASARPGRRTEIVDGEGDGFGETGKTPAEALCITGDVGEAGAKFKDDDALQDDTKDEVRVGCGVVAGTAEEGGAKTRNSEEAVGVSRAAADMAGTKCQPPSDVGKAHNVPQSVIPHTNASWESTSDGDFTLVLDCCDLTVSKVEALDILSVPAMSSLLEEVKCQGSGLSTAGQSAALIQKLVSIPSGQWREQHQLFSQCSQAPASQGGGTLRFHTDRWSLQVRKRGAGTPQDFPRALRICYETRPEGGSVTWTRDQDNRVCVYTAGSPINNRALFACQEPPVAMSTWQARVRAPSECVVLMSGENQATPTEEDDTGLLIWDYYVTMPMPASTFTLAVGHWRQATAEFTTAVESWLSGKMECGEMARAGPGSETVAGPAAGAGSSTSEVIKCSTLQTGSGDQTGSSSVFCDFELEGHSVACFPDTVDESVSCSHGDYPCRFTEPSAWSQRVVPHRVFAPDCLLQKAQMGVLSLLPQCLAAAHAVLGVHPFPRLDVLIVPAGFSSLGMASPHIVFLSQSVLCADGAGERGQALCGSRLCHELAHAWFGLAIGARDWTEEWISEGFATYLEDIIWAQTQQLSPLETAEQCDLKALLRWRRLSDELHNSEEQLQVLRPNMENTGQVSESGSSVVKHALNPVKTFMQVHYLKGYFLLRFLGSQVGEQQFIDFFRLFVKKYHGQLILSQDFLRMLLATFPDMGRRHGLTLSAVYAQWLDQPGIPKWLCERSAVWSQARLVDEVKAEVIKWIQLSRSRGKGRKRKKAEPKVNYKEVSSDQLLLLLELLLEEAELSVTSLRSLERTYCLQKQDAEVRHRWCELVVKHGLSQAYRDVEHFLVHDQAMGVYLYGELMVQEDPDQQALARRCLSLVREEMDQSARRVVEEMVL